MNDLFYQMRIEHLTMYQILVLDVKLIDANILYIKFYNCCRTFTKIIKEHIVLRAGRGVSWHFILSLGFYVLRIMESRASLGHHMHTAGLTHATHTCSGLKCTQQQKHSHMQTLERKEQKSANTCMHTCSSATHMQTIHTHSHMQLLQQENTSSHTLETHTRWKLTHAKSRKALGRYSRAAGEEMHNTHAKQTHSDTTRTNSQQLLQ
ncbi:hypothetical protein I3843_08G108900 [Carya illinoinensis]|nr:hypothetical protein I3843_08G108900 [Carya illinoinensis]